MLAYCDSVNRRVESTEDDDMASVFKVLADPTRRRLLDRLHADNGQSLSELCQGLAATRQGVTQHLALLEGAGLITTIRRGRQKLHYLNPVPLHEINERWIAKFERSELAALSTLKHRLEEDRPMDKPRLVYVTYIATTTERLWSALTDPEQTAVYWKHRNVSGWSKGDRWEHVRLDGGSDGGGTITEIDPPHRLSHTWGSSDDPDAGPPSRVTFDLEPVGDAVRLTVTHEDLAPNEADDVSDGWAMVLSSLKSWLETGQPIGSLF
jgi:uncharacterized protein YndB with AHSA1/START domain/DNA-binding transcriptional ArsR family regulator